MTQHAYTGIDHLRAMECAHNYNRFLVDAILDACPAGRALDFGAGRGTLALAVRERGLEPICIERDAELCRMLENLDLMVFRRLSEANHEPVDFVYSMNVLEHIKDDAAAILEIRETLSPGGIFLLYVPAFPILYTAMDSRVGHFRRYRLTPLCQLLKDQGFEVQAARYVDSLGFLATLAYKYFGSQTGDISPRQVKTYDRWLFPISRLADSVFDRMLGKNIMIKSRRV